MHDAKDHARRGQDSATCRHIWLCAGRKPVDGTSPINTNSAPGTATTAPTTSGILTHVQERRCTPTSKAPIIEGSSAQRTGTWNEVTTSTLADKSRS
jgi:hypothetical protein